MIRVIEIDEFFNRLFGETLAKARLIDPELGNSKQVELHEEVQKIALGVTLHEDFLREAIAANADTLIVHHGLKISAPHQIFLPFHTKRLDMVFKHRLNIYGFHGALDMHPTIGNNAVIARELHATLIEPYFEQFGWVAELATPMRQQELATQVSNLTNHDVFSVMSSKKTVKRLGIVSGGGIPKEPHLLEMIEKDIDVHITGEISEGTVHRMKEMDIAYFAAGHYATEVFGVQELGKNIKKNFRDRVEVEFIDIPNPI